VSEQVLDDAVAKEPPSEEWSLPQPLNALHPLGWAAVGFAILSGLATVFGWDLLIGRLPVWVWALVVATVVAAAVPSVLHGLRLGIEAVSQAGAGVAMFLAWFVFVIQLFNVITRYSNDWFERDILFGQTTSLAWMSFGMLFLAGVAGGVKNGIKPRIDFWWAEFSIAKKAALDFVLHLLIFLPFLILAIRVLIPYAASTLGYNRFANGGEGEWRAGWRVWNSWEQSPDAGQLPIGPIRSLILAAFVLWTAQVVAELIKTGFVLIGRNDLGDVVESEVPLRVE